MEQHQRKGRRVVLFPVPLKGHINPMLHLGQILHSNGFSVAVIHTNFNSPDASSYPHFTFHRISDGLDDQDHPATTSNVLSLFPYLNASCLEPFEACLREVVSDAAGEPVACLVVDAHFHFTQGVSERLRIPRIVLRTGGACSFHLFTALPLLKGKGYLQVQAISSSDSDKDKLLQLVISMVSTAKNSAGLILNTFEGLEQPSLDELRRELPVPIFPIGPFHKLCRPANSRSSVAHNKAACISWLDKHNPRSVIYVSFGSIAETKESEFEEIACCLRNSGRPFLWVARPDSDVRTAARISSGLAGDECIVKWAPQLEVLSHPSVGAFWTHCGWNSTMEGISEGVPMICTPCFAEQMVNSRFICDVWRVGVELEMGRNGLERGRIERAIRSLFQEKEGEEIRNRMNDLKEKASLCLKQGEGSSFNAIDGLARHIMLLESVTFGNGGISA
ncbi:hypothetical protein SAY86_024328 [Trapa natans]|uniref:Uncharacterized protein n=1 Tax=Trapa natans TaxID=22666 RepID=A0AAN7RJK0_TRANT|nr:hypothetical protein SAY86_024328 [Trapa natans]